MTTDRLVGSVLGHLGCLADCLGGWQLVKQLGGREARSRAFPITRIAAPGKPGAAASGRFVQRDRPSPMAPADRSRVLGLTVPSVVGLARCLDVHPTRHRDRLAAATMPRALAAIWSEALLLCKYCGAKSTLFTNPSDCVCGRLPLIIPAKERSLGPVPVSGGDSTPR